MHSAHTRRSASVFPGCRHERDGGPADAKTPPFRGTEQRRLLVAWDNTVLACCSACHRHMGSILTCVPGSFLYALPASASGLLMGYPTMTGFRPGRISLKPPRMRTSSLTAPVVRGEFCSPPRGTLWGALSSSAPRSGLLACAIRGCHVTLFGCDYALCSSSQRSQRPRLPCSSTGGCSDPSRRVSSADDFGSTGI